MSKTKLLVEGLPVSIESIGEADFISLTDIAKRSESSRPDVLIMAWMKMPRRSNFWRHGRKFTTLVLTPSIWMGLKPNTSRTAICSTQKHE